jgi:hypothetical protein
MDWVIECTKSYDGLDVAGTPSAIDVYRRHGLAVLDACTIEDCIGNTESICGKGEYKEFVISHPRFGKGKLITYDLKDGVDGVFPAPRRMVQWHTANLLTLTGRCAKRAALHANNRRRHHAEYKPRQAKSRSRRVRIHITPPRRAQSGS